MLTIVQNKLAEYEIRKHIFLGDYLENLWLPKETKLKRWEMVKGEKNTQN